MLLAGEAEGRLLEQLLGRCKRPGLLKGRGRRGTDAADVRASVRTRNRLEWLAEMLSSPLFGALSSKLFGALHATVADFYEK
jgi:hypothetical protein